MKILLLGGTGAMGVHLADILAKDGKEVYITSRSPHQDEPSKHYIVGNAKESAFMKTLMQDKWDCVVDFMVRTTKEFCESGIIDLILENTSQYIYISSCRVFSDRDEIITESTPRLLDVTPDKVYLETDEYALAKARQEDYLRASGRQNWTIVRPYITFSEQRLQLGVLEKEYWLTRVLGGRSILFSKDIDEKYTTMTYGRDVAKGIAGLVGNQKAFGEDFNIASSESMLWKEVRGIYEKALREAMPKMKETVLQERSIYLTLRGHYYQTKYDRLYNRSFDNTKILDAVPELRFSNPREKLRECLKSFLSSPRFHAVPNDSVSDRYTGDWVNLKRIPTIKKKASYLAWRIMPEFMVRRLLKQKN